MTRNPIITPDTAILFDLGDVACHFLPDRRLSALAYALRTTIHPYLLNHRAQHHPTFPSSLFICVHPASKASEWQIAFPWNPERPFPSPPDLDFETVIPYHERPPHERTLVHYLTTILRPHLRTCLAGILMLTLMPAGVSANTDLLEREGITVLSTHEGDRCLVSGVLLDENGVAFVYRGRRVSLHKDAIGVFLAEPDRYFSRLQPKGALFQENQIWFLSVSWLFLGVWMTLGLVCGAAASHIALRKGRSPGFWFAAGVALNVVALVTVLTRPSETDAALPSHLGKIPTTHAPVPCPSCDATNHPSASSCSSCGAQLSPTLESEVQRK